MSSNACITLITGVETIKQQTVSAYGVFSEPSLGTLSN